MSRESALTVTKSKEESKLIIKNLPEAMRVECDKLFSATKTAAASRAEANKAESPMRKALYELSKNTDEVKKAGFKSFGEFAERVFGLASSAATNAAKVGEKFDSGKQTPLVEWYSFYQLYELRDVSREQIDADVESGILHPNMTTEQLRDYNRAHKLDDGKPVLVKMYDAHITVVGEVPFHFEGTMDEIKVKMWDSLGIDTVMEDDRFGTYNPHIITKKGEKEVKLKGMFLAVGTKVILTAYTPSERKKAQSETDATIEAQNKTIAELMAKLKALEGKKG